MKGVEASFARTEAKVTMHFHCLFDLKCCSKQESDIILTKDTDIILTQN